MKKLDIDDMLNVEMENCFSCGETLIKKNKSKWYIFAKINNEIVSVPQCLNCEKTYFSGGKKVGCVDTKKDKIHTTH